ncbi:Truncated hemoglobin [Planctomycetales bacterium 10988]|nr:Truncated hemoglobin [Planctomycetales bacterium 10988]
MSEPNDPSIYDLIGDEGFQELVHNFYQQIPADPILGPLYEEVDLQEAEQRLLDFLIFRFGGPDTYLRERGHPRLRMRHARFPVTQEARDRWIQLMENALRECDFLPDIKQTLMKYFEDAATFLRNS